MAIVDEIRWFKQNFVADILPALAGTPLSFDLICAIAFQESGELWSKLRLHLPRSEILRLSVGDTLDAPNRSAFPRTKQVLVGTPKGQQMFDLAHQLLVEMGDGTGIEAYQHLGTNPDKFVHGYGIFQYDLQFFRSEPDFFLMQKWQDIAACVEKLMVELRGALEDLDLSNETSLTRWWVTPSANPPAKPAPPPSLRSTTRPSHPAWLRRTVVHVPRARARYRRSGARIWRSHGAGPFRGRLVRGAPG